MCQRIKAFTPLTINYKVHIFLESHQIANPVQGCEGGLLFVTIGALVASVSASSLFFLMSVCK